MERRQLMSKCKKALLLLAVLFTTFTLSNGLLPESAAEQSGSFSGTWIASGQRQTFDFVEGREVGPFKLAGNVSLI
jgi:hypothetical protein